MQEVLVLSREEVESVLSLKEAIDVVEDAFSDFANKRVVLPPAIGFPVEKHHGEMHIKSGYMMTPDSVAVKIASSFPENPKIGLPTVQAFIAVYDASNGSLLSIMDGSYITTVRTGAAGAVAAKHLSKKDSKIVGIVGTGVQGRIQLRALNEVRNIERVKAFSIDKAEREKYARGMSDLLSIDIKPVNSVEDAVKDADILITATPSHNPMVKKDWLHPGLHINAIGSDNPKKQELFSDSFLKINKIVADRLEQCKVAGEIHHGIEDGFIKESDIYAELGEITSGRKAGRENSEEITLFDSTGVAIQDISVASMVYRLAKKRKAGKIIKL